MISASLVPLLYAGIGSVGIAYTLQVIGQKDLHPAPAALILSLEMVFAAIAGALLLAERFSLRGIIGCVLMFAGIVLAQLAPSPVSGGAAHEPASPAERERSRKRLVE
jgi:drug/metabolite transporter (DMT)-like permease